jgi:hypothetical protein
MSEAGEAVEVEDVVNAPGAGVVAVCAKKKNTAAGLDRAAKRPRWGDKAFEDITLGDVEELVRKCNRLEKLVDTNGDAAQELKEALKREKELEKQLTVRKCEVDEAKSAIKKQMQAQMLYASSWDEELAWGGRGREICAFLPSVSPEMLKALGGELNHPKSRRTTCFFDKVPSKTMDHGKKKKVLVLGSTVTLKYIKTSSELHVKASYTIGALEKRPKCKVKSDAAEVGNTAEAEDANAADAADAAAEAEDAEDAADEEAAADAENDEEAANNAESCGLGKHSNEDVPNDVGTAIENGGHGGA